MDEAQGVRLICAFPYHYLLTKWGGLMNSIQRSLRLVGLAVLALGMFGCGSSLNNPGTGTGGGRGGGVGTGGAAGVGADGGRRDGNVDGPATDAPLVCPQPVSTACFNGACSTTWAEVLATRPVCVLFNVAETRSMCGDYYVDVFAYVESEIVNYYDKSTGQLVARYSFGAEPPQGGGNGCIAGPPGGIASCVPSSVTPGGGHCSQDGGAADGAHQDATAGDALGSSG